MSEQSKKTVQEVKEAFKKLGDQADAFHKKAAPLDGELASKIKRVQESSQEVVKHIEKRSDTKQS